MADSADAVAKYLQSAYGSVMPVQFPRSGKRDKGPGAQDTLKEHRRKNFAGPFTVRLYTGSNGKDVHGNSFPPVGGAAGSNGVGAGDGYSSAGGNAVGGNAAGGNISFNVHAVGGNAVGGNAAGGNSAPPAGGGGGGTSFRPGGAAGAVFAYGGGGSGGGRYGAPAPTPGLAGFGEAGEEDFAAGTITGYRWWHLPVPDFHRSPLEADERWVRELLSGQYEQWFPGINEAACNAGQGAHEEEVPAAGCGCGYWSYWKLSSHNLGSRLFTMPVSGVIEGWGRTRVGELGFRCAKARILALHLPFTIVASVSQGGWYDSLELPSAGLSAVDADRLETWMAVIETRLEQMYPGIKVFANQAAMLAKFPLTGGYGRLPR